MLLIYSKLLLLAIARHENSLFESEIQQLKNGLRELNKLRNSIPRKVFEELKSPES